MVKLLLMLYCNPDKCQERFLAEHNCRTVSDRDPGYNPGYCRDLGFCWDPGTGKISLLSPGFHRNFIEKK